MSTTQPHFELASDCAADYTVARSKIQKRCSRCLYDSETPQITFDEKGECSYCKLHDEMDKEYPIGEEGERQVPGSRREIKRDGRGKKYDCVIGVSGGCDSSYLLHRAVELGLRPLAAHFDNTWNSAVATDNIHRV